MKKTVLRDYARLIVRTGANVQKGQEVLIQAELDQPEFVTMVVEEAYKAGASKVRVDWLHQPLTRLHVRYQTEKTLSEVTDWELEKIRHRVKTLPANIYLVSEDPDGLKNVNQKKYGKAMQKRGMIIKPLRDEMENKYQWCIAAVPGVKWAKKVFPNEPKGRAVEKLWQCILEASRATEDAVAAWEAHNNDLHRRADYLNSLGLRELRYHAGNGTDFRVGLIPDACFMGGSEPLPTTGVIYNPNIPTEEIFVSPKSGDADGIVYSSKPLSYQGALITDFSIRFENGKAVEVHARENEELLRHLISMDEGSSKLGECALVPYHSPISEQNILYYNTLFDENAACHLALGMGFANCIRDYEKYTLEECRAKGINDSIIHEDFMIGTPDLSIDGVTEDGRIIPIFRNGDWAFD